MIKNYTKSTAFLLAFLLISYIGSINLLYAQQSFQLPGPVSQLKITPDGKLGCQMHMEDGISDDHHALEDRLNPPSSYSNSNGRKAKSTGAVIFVDYYNFDPTFTPEEFAQAKAAFQSAVDTWATLLDSDEPIFVAAVFQELGPGVLGSAGPTSVFANFNGAERDSWYGNALADKLAEEDLTPTSYDIIARFSTVFPNWYYGTDGQTPPSDYDLKTVVLHELCHGLGFFGSMNVDNATGIGSYGFGIPEPVFPAIYDRLNSSSDRKSILKENRYPNFSEELGSALLSGTLNSKGPNIKKASTGKGIEIFTTLSSEDLGFEIPGLTDLWLRGSSYSHVDFLTYAGGPDGLMVPFLSRGLSYSTPGELTLAIFDDIGWNGKVNRQVKNARIAQNEFDDTIYDKGLKVYPNPITDRFSINLQEADSRIVNVSLIDAMGRNIGLSFNRVSVDLLDFDLSQNALKPGAYVLRLHLNNDESRNIRIMKN